MDKVVLGKTGIEANKNGFGALPIQRISKKDAVYLLQKAFYHGVDYFDTARAYSDSEEKMGAALSWVRDRIVISTKTAATDVETFWKDLETSLGNLQTDYIDIYQFHNPAFCPKPGDGTGLYEAMEEAKATGKIRHIGITNHRLAVAREAIESGLYETLQFPFSYLASEKDREIVDACREAGMGFIAMKGLAGGLIRNSACAYAYLAQPEFSHVAPIWGVQRESELDEVPVLPGESAQTVRGSGSSDPGGPGAVVRGFLPGLRILYALSGGDQDQRLCPYEPNDPQSAPGGLGFPGVAGRNEEDRELPPLWTVQEQMSLRAGYAGAAGEELRGL